MISDYRVMFSAHNRKLNLNLLVLIVVFSLMFYWATSTTRSVFLPLYFLFFGGMSAVYFLSPLWVWLVGPIVISMLQIPRKKPLKVFFRIQYFMDRFLIEALEKSFLYPKADD